MPFYQIDEDFIGVRSVVIKADSEAIAWKHYTEKIKEDDFSSYEVYETLDAKLSQHLFTEQFN